MVTQVIHVFLEGYSRAKTLGSNMMYQLKNQYQKTFLNFNT